MVFAMALKATSFSMSARICFTVLAMAPPLWVHETPPSFFPRVVRYINLVVGAPAGCCEVTPTNICLKARHGSTTLVSRRQ